VGDVNWCMTRGSGMRVEHREPILELLINVSFLESVPRLLQLLLHFEELLGDFGDLLLSVQ
jgi:hypothetical protein